MKDYILLFYLIICNKSITRAEKAFVNGQYEKKRFSLLRQNRKRIFVCTIYCRKKPFLYYSGAIYCVNLSFDTKIRTKYCWNLRKSFLLLRILEISITVWYHMIQSVKKYRDAGRRFCAFFRRFVVIFEKLKGTGEFPQREVK